MKFTILSLFVTLLASFSVQAGTMATGKLGADTTLESGLIKLFNDEAVKVGSPLNTFIKELKADPDNEYSTIDDTITSQDLVRLDSGASAGKFGVSYLILIRSGYKSSSTIAAYLKATVYGSIEDDGDTTIEINEPAKVSIE